MKLSEIERLHYKGSVELGRETHRYTVDIFYDPESKLVYQVIRELNKWRMVAQGSPASKDYLEKDWSDLDD